MVRAIPAILSLLWLISCNTEQPETVSINWLSFEEAVDLQQEVSKPIIVAVHVNWCNVCKKMENTSFTNPVVANYINEHFYAVLFDAEQKSPVNYQGVTYEYDGQGRRGTHALAKEITDQQLTYPTTTFLDEKLNVIQPTSGYLDAAAMERLIKFVGSDAHSRMDFETFSTDESKFELKLDPEKTWKSKS